MGRMVGAGRRERVALTTKAIKAAVYTGRNGERVVLWDPILPGFGCRVLPTGRKAFVLKYRTRDDRQRLTTIGPFPTLTIDEARKRARRLMGQVLDGADPVGDRKKAKKAITFRELAEQYLQHHADVHKRSARDDRQRIRDYLLPAWGARKADAVGRSEVAAVLQRIGQEKPVVANRVRALVSKMFNWAEATGVMPEGTPNPARRIQSFKEVSRDRWLTVDEVTRLMREVESLENIHLKGFYWLSLLLGTRRGELLRARWQDVDLVRGVLRLPETKQGKVHTIPLSASARAIFDQLPREAANEFVFPGAKPGSSLVEIRSSWDRIRRNAGVEDVRFHDLRRTLGSWMAQRGASLPLIGAVLGHSQPSTTQIYARFRDDSARGALEEHAIALVEAAGITPLLGPGSPEHVG